MRAMVLEHPAPVDQSPLQLREWPKPEPKDNQIRVAIRCCGICHTDLHTVEGELRLPKIPLIPGHQIVGIVEARGSSAYRFREGDRVGVPWLFRTDGTCRYCLSGKENLCDHAEFTGLNANGGYAEYMLVEEDFAYSLPSTFDDAHVAPLLCAGVIGYRSFCLSGARSRRSRRPVRLRRFGAHRFAVRTTSGLRGVCVQPRGGASADGFAAGRGLGGRR